MTPDQYAGDIVACVLRREDLSDRTLRYLRGRVELAVAQAVAEERRRIMAIMEDERAWECTTSYGVAWNRIEAGDSVGESEGAVGRSQGP